MIRERIEVEIVDGNTTLTAHQEEVPVFATVPDTTYTLGQYAGTLGGSHGEDSQKNAATSKSSAVPDTCYL